METIFSTSKSFFRVGKVRDVLKEKINFDFLNDLELEKHPKCAMGIMHRHIGFFGDTEGYRYTGQITKSQSLTPELRSLLKKVNSVFCYDSDYSYNGILINYYDNGEDSIGEHRDNESNLYGDLGVLAISIGYSRTFRVRTQYKGSGSKKTGESRNVTFSDGSKKIFQPGEIVYEHRT